MSNIIPLFPPKPTPSLASVMQKLAEAYVAADDDEPAPGERRNFLPMIYEVAEAWGILDQMPPMPRGPAQVVQFRGKPRQRLVSWAANILAVSHGRALVARWMP